MPPACQPQILRPVPPAARFVTFGFQSASPAAAARVASEALARLAEAPHDGRTVVGLGAPFLAALPGIRAVPGLRPFPIDLALFPATQHALWLCLAHADHGAIFDAGAAFAKRLGPGFAPTEEVDAFFYRGGRDLTGFEDGTENPKGRAARAAALVAGRGRGLDGGSFVLVQRWRHDLAAMQAMSETARDHVIGRKLRGNRELADAPPSAHVKRTAQESFSPPAFVLRRSMPWGGAAEHGLYFVAYAESLDRVERLLRRMAGRDDGVVDGLFAFSRALTGGYYFCPPVLRGRLDLRALGVG